MRMLLRWAPVEKEWDDYGEEVVSEFSRKNIQLIVGIHGLSENDSYNFLADLERAINQDLEGTCGKAGFLFCSGYGEEKQGTLFDCIAWKRDRGYVREQKAMIMESFKNAYMQLEGKYKEIGENLPDI